MRCASCGKPLTGNFSKGNGGRYAYYHCRLPCRVVNISKANSKGRSSTKLRPLQPTPVYIKVLEERVLQVWRDRNAAVHGCA